MNPLFVIALIFYDGIHIIILNVLMLFFIFHKFSSFSYFIDIICCVYITQHVLYFYAFIVVFFFMSFCWTNIL